jgi:hypothetical protein
MYKLVGSQNYWGFGFCPKSNMGWGRQQENFDEASTVLELSCKDA